MRGVLARNIRRYRRALGWSQAELARQCRGGVSLSSVKLYELDINQNPNLDTLRTIAGALGCQPWHLLLDGDVPDASTPGSEPREAHR